ncbi:MAG: hypothetical protein ACNS60_08320 [Candidatus Cyclobacteriaceae bacterium M2_1C_046]
MKNFKISILFAFLASLIILSACDDDHLHEHNEEEIITDVVLTFTPQDGGSAVTVLAQDPDGEGPQDIAPTDSIRLNPTTTYVLTLELENSVANESITQEIVAEAGEHMFFYGFTDALFASPAGDGNIDDRNDPVIYNDEDANGQPLGLSTTWTTDGAATGSFTVILKHQPGTKSATSTATDGETDVDITFGVRVN